MIEKADLDKRKAELVLERDQQLIAVNNLYNGAIQEIDRLLSNFNSELDNNQTNNKTKEK